MAALMAAWMAAPRLVDQAAELDRSTAAAPLDGRPDGRPAWLPTRSTNGRDADLAAAADRPRRFAFPNCPVRKRFRISPAFQHTKIFLLDPLP